MKAENTHEITMSVYVTRYPGKTIQTWEGYIQAKAPEGLSSLLTALSAAIDDSKGGDFYAELDLTRAQLINTKIDKFEILESIPIPRIKVEKKPDSNNSLTVEYDRGRSVCIWSADKQTLERLHRILASMARSPCISDNKFFCEDWGGSPDPRLPDLSLVSGHDDSNPLNSLIIYTHPEFTTVGL